MKELGMTEEFGMTELVLRAAASARIDLFLQILTKQGRYPQLGEASCRVTRRDVMQGMCDAMP